MAKKPISVINIDNSELFADGQVASNFKSAEETTADVEHDTAELDFDEAIFKPLKKKVGRPRANVDADTVFRLASMHCTNQEIAEWFGVAEATIQGNFQRELSMGRANLKVATRRMMFIQAMRGSERCLLRLDDRLNGPIVQKQDVQLTELAQLDDQALSDRISHALKQAQQELTPLNDDMPPDDIVDGQIIEDNDNE
jgi:hypothetical protein